jgi:hypothetical protein
MLFIPWQEQMVNFRSGFRCNGLTRAGLLCPFLWTVLQQSSPGDFQQTVAAGAFSLWPSLLCTVASLLTPPGENYSFFKASGRKAILYSLMSDYTRIFKKSKPLFVKKRLSVLALILTLCYAKTQNFLRKKSYFAFEVFCLLCIQFSKLLWTEH